MTLGFMQEHFPILNFISVSLDRSSVLNWIHQTPSPFPWQEVEYISGGQGGIEQLSTVTEIKRGWFNVRSDGVKGTRQSEILHSLLKPSAAEVRLSGETRGTTADGDLQERPWDGWKSSGSLN